jgi:hypothetical protein
MNLVIPNEVRNLLSLDTISARDGNHSRTVSQFSQRFAAASVILKVFRRPRSIIRKKKPRLITGAFVFLQAESL